MSQQSQDQHFSSLKCPPSHPIPTPTPTPLRSQRCGAAGAWQLFAYTLLTTQLFACA